MYYSCLEDLQGKSVTVEVTRLDNMLVTNFKKTILVSKAKEQ
jgi:hypothetical protein